MSLRDNLQSTLGASYVIDRELGGGGSPSSVTWPPVLLRYSHPRPSCHPNSRNASSELWEMRTPYVDQARQGLARLTSEPRP